MDFTSFLDGLMSQEPLSHSLMTEIKPVLHAFLRLASQFPEQFRKPHSLQKFPSSDVSLSAPVLALFRLVLLVNQNGRLAKFWSQFGQLTSSLETIDEQVKHG